MPRGRLALLGALGVVGALELYGVATDADTISAMTADVFGVEDASGRWLFGVAWLAFSAWYGHHVWRFRMGSASPKDTPEGAASIHDA